MSEEKEQLQAEGAPGDAGLEVPLRFGVPAGMPSRYAHHLIVQQGESEVLLSFFEVIPPLLVGSPDEQKETLKKGVRADCVARITVSKSRYPDFVRVLNSILE